MLPTRSVLWHVCDILQQEMGLLPGTVFVYKQKINLPPGNGIYIAVGMQSAKPFGSKTSVDDGVETQTLHMSAMLSIDIMSRSPDALDRKEDLVLALGSTYSRQKQERLGFNIGRIPTSFIDLSEVEGTAIPYRFNLAVQVQYLWNKQKSVAYYDDFTDTELSTEA